MAGGITLGFLKYVLGFDSITFRKGMTDAERDLVALQKSFEKKGKAIQSFGKSLTAFVTLPIAGIAAAGIKEAQETQQAMAQVNASLASMGPVAQRSAGQLKGFADALELKSTFEADEILRDVTANMLTFGNVQGAVFDRAQQVTVDLATKMKKGLLESTVLVGKALNDPVKGMKALTKAGIQFSPAQQQVIKNLVATGQTAKAQALILGELERQFKGSAAAAANADPLNRANKAWKQMAETIGTALLPLLDNFAIAVAAVANAFGSLSPATQQTIIVVGGVAAAIGPVLIGFGGLVRVIAGMPAAVTALAGAFKALQAAFIVARVAALATLPALLPILVPLAAITVAVGAAYLAWRNWDKIKAIVSGVAAAVKHAFVDRLEPIWNYMRQKIGAVVDLFRWMWDKLVGHSYVPDTVNAIQHHFGRLHSVMVAPTEKAAKAATAAFKKLKDDVGQLLDQLFPEDAQFRQDIANFALLEKAAQKGLISAEKLSEARRRILGISGDAEVSSDLLNPQVADQLPGGLDEQAIDRILPKLDTIVDKSRQWGDAVSNVGRELGDILANDLSAMIEGTGKLKDLWKDLLALGIRQLTSSNGLFASFFGGARASGGPVLSSKAYLVGERGPEIFMPSSSGRILSNADSRAMGGRWGAPQVAMTVYAQDANSFGRSERQITRGLQRRLSRA